jgi:predicted phage terminase large subunit-like protein
MNSKAVQTRAQLEVLQREAARRRLMPFVQRFNPGYLPGWVHQDICRRLERFSREVAEKKSPRLMILMPPRHGKSELASRNFPPWHLGQYPDHEFIACSYNLSLAMTFSRKVKEIIADPLYQTVFQTQLDPNNQSVEAWGLNQARGGYVAAGIGGPITGRGAHVLVIDDPVKNAEEADSADTREKVWEWYLSTAYSRLAPGGGVLIIQTWWHDDDLAGRLQTLMRSVDPEDADFVDKFDVVKYPAIAEADEWLETESNKIVHVEHDFPIATKKNDQGEVTEVSQSVLMATARAQKLGVDITGMKLLRIKGEALHPARYDLDKLLRIKAQNKGGRWWSALYQQNPVPDDGGYFQRDQFQQTAPPSLRLANVFIAWDFAISEKKQNDYTVGTVALQDFDDMLHVVDQVRFKSGDAFYIVEAILNLASRWHNPSLVIGFEDGQIYRAIEALLKKRMKERGFYPPTTVLKPITDKLARGRALQGRMQQKMVSFAAGAPWFNSLRTEMLRFPAGVNDDQVDSLSWIAQMVVGREPPKPPVQKALKSWRDKLRTDGALTHMAA